MLREGHHPQQGRLAGTAGADQEMVGAGVELQGYSLQAFRPVSIAQHDLLEANQDGVSLFPAVGFEHYIPQSVPSWLLLASCFSLGRAHVITPVTHAQLLWRLLLGKKNSVHSTTATTKS